MVTSISPTSATSQDNITLYGSGFGNTSSDDNFILFGEVECAVTYYSDILINCTLGEGQAGNKTLWLHVLSVGVANTNDIILDYYVYIDGIQPATSGLGGGVTMVIDGSGFIPADNSVAPGTSLGYTYPRDIDEPGCITWTNEVTVGDNECIITMATRTTIHCIVPPADVVGYVDVGVALYCDDVVYYEDILTGGYSYDDSITPNVTSVTPSSGSGRGGTYITIIGTGFSTNAVVMVSNVPTTTNPCVFLIILMESCYY